MSDINVKSLIDQVISQTPGGEFKNTGNQDRGLPVFDKRDCKNKLSMLVLKDLIRGMMRDEPIEGLDNMINVSLGKYLNDPAFKGCDAYDYMCRSRDRLSSPMLGELIQELDDAADKLDADSKEGKKIDIDNYDINDILKNIENYDDLRNTLKEIVSQKVVRDVTKTIVKSNDAPTFENLDEKLAQTDDNTTQESIILNISGQIFKEAYRHDKNADSNTALRQAIVEYCVYQLSQTFKQYPRTNIFVEYDIKPVTE